MVGSPCGLVCMLLLRCGCWCCWCCGCVWLRLAVLVAAVVRYGVVVLYVCVVLVGVVMWLVRYVCGGHALCSAVG